MLFPRSRAAACLAPPIKPSERCKASFAGLRERMADLRHAIVECLEQARERVDMDDHLLPDGRQACEDNDVLYHSSRSYLDQLHCTNATASTV